MQPTVTRTQSDRQEPAFGEGSGPFQSEAAQSRLHSAIFQGTSDAIFLVDPANDRIYDANLTAQKFLGYTRDDLLRLPMSAVHPNEMPTLIEFAKKVWDTGPRRSDEFSCLTKSGVSVPAELSASPIEVEGRSLLLVYARDISQRREIEAQLYQAQKMEMVGQLTGGGRARLQQPVGSHHDEPGNLDGNLWRPR